MAPKKKRARQASTSKAATTLQRQQQKKKKRPRGLLGVASSGYNSESDEDFNPTAAAGAAARRPRASPASRAAQQARGRGGRSSSGKRRRAAAAATTDSSDDDDYSENSDSDDSSSSSSSSSSGGSHPSSTEPEADSDSTDTSDSNETLSARQQRRAGKGSAPAAAAAAAGRGGRRGSSGNNARGAAAAAARSGRGARAQQPQQQQQPQVVSWDNLPAAVLAQIFTGVCKHGALPMAPRLACVCISWRAAVDATPELWRVLDTAAIPARAWSAACAGAAGGSGGGSGSGAGGSGKGQGRAGFKQGYGRASKTLLPTAEEGLAHWVASGRLQELRALLLYAGGVGGSSTADQHTAGTLSAAGYDGGASEVNRQPSAGLLMQIAESCQQLQRVSLFGAWSLRNEEVSAALLAMPALSELCFCGVRFSAISGLSACVSSVLEAAVATGHPRLKELVVDGCLSLTQKAVTPLFLPAAAAGQQPPSNAAQAAAPHAADAGGHQQPQPQQDGGHHAQLQDQQQQQQQQPVGSSAAAAPSAPSAAATAAPAFSCLEVLDLSNSGRTSFRLQLEDMQAAMPRLRVLKLSGLGGMYGWQPIAPRGSSSSNAAEGGPGFPALEALHVDIALTAPSGGMLRHTGASFVTDAVLLQLAGKSTQLMVLDLSGSQVTSDGLAKLAARHTACRLEQAAAQPSAAAVTQTTPGAADGAVAAAATTAAGIAPGNTAAVAPAASTAAAAAAAKVSEGALHIRDLQLDGSNLACDDGLVAVGEYCYNTLEQLVVRNAGSRLGDDGIRSLSECRRLAALDITGCSVTEQGLRDLLSALPAGGLEELHLESCRGISRGARQAAARGVAQLQAYLDEHADG